MRAAGLLRLALIVVLVPLLAAPGVPRRRVAAAGGSGDAEIGVRVHVVGASNDPLTTGAISTTTGSAIVCGVTWTPAVDFTAFSDSASNTWTQIGTEVTIANSDSRLYYCQNCTGSASHTFTMDYSGLPSTSGIACVELKNVQTAGVLDQSNQGTDNASPYASPSITTTQAAEVLVGFTSVNDAAVSNISESTGFTVQAEENGANSMPFAIMTRIVSSTGTYNYSYTRTGTNDTANFIASFKD